MTLRPKSPAEIEIMREGGHILNQVLEDADVFIKKGRSLKEIDHYIHSRIVHFKAMPSFLGYKGYPATSCLSLNEVVVHGLPTDSVLQEGDIIGIDVGVKWRNYHTDAAFTKVIGQTDDARKKLLLVTQEALRIGIDAARSGNRVGDIGKAIEEYVSKQGNYGIIRDLSGHGVGTKLQEAPEIPNYATPDPTPLMNGMTLAIEPMISLGDWHVKVLDDTWTVVTSDRSPAAHFETTLVIRDNDPEILVPFPLSYSC